MKNICPTFLPLERGDTSAKFLLVLGLILSYCFLLYAVPAFDDFHLPAKFSGLVAQHGYLKTIWVLLSGMDMPNQYRTYELSRLLQFFLWSIGGAQSSLFPLVIAFTQVVSAIALLYVLRDCSIGEQQSLAVATLWLISPFSVNWCFHHYSYLLLPFQIVIVTTLVLGRITTRPNRYLIVVILGIASALAGEMFLISGPLALLLTAYVTSDKSRARLSVALISVMITTLVLHHWLWVEFFQDVSQPQRYQFIKGVGVMETLSHALVALLSVPKSAWLQLREISLTGFAWGGLFGGVIASAYWLASARSTILQFARTDSTTPKKTISSIHLAFVFFGLALSTLLIYFALSILSGQVYEIMPRRYGYVPLTLMLIGAVMTFASISNRLFGSERLILTIFVGLVGSFSGQMFLGMMPNARAADQLLVTAMKDAGGLDMAHPTTEKGVLFFVSANNEYLLANANGGTTGPKMDGEVGIELMESPFGAYWTTQAYSANLLGFRFAGMPKSNIVEGSIEIGGEGGRPSISNISKVSPEEVVVVANLGFDQHDPLGHNVKVFKNFSEFQPYFFSRKIRRDVLELDNAKREEVIVDLGLTQPAPARQLGILPDKKFSEPMERSDKGWIANYGLIEGQDSVYTNTEVSGVPNYYRTNRNGTFTYGVAFDDVGIVEVSLDFWEQWRNLPGERVFELEVSWDGGTWASLGKIDIVSLNQNRPVSIVLTKMNPKVFQFRMKSAAGSPNIPVIQGFRIRKVTSL